MSGGQASLQTLISSQEEKRDPGQHEGDDGGYEESCRMKAMVWDNLGDERERERERDLSMVTLHISQSGHKEELQQKQHGVSETGLALAPALSPLAETISA